MTAWNTEDWYVSRYNAEVANDLHPQAFICDCTLREGEQQAGVVLSRPEKIRLAHALDEIGFPQLEVGMPSVSEWEEGTVRAIARERLNARLIAVCRSTEADIDQAARCGVWGVSCSLPIGELQIKYKLKWPEDKVLETAIRITSYAHAKGLFVLLSPYDTTRTDPVFLERFVRTVAKEGWVDRIRVVDTVGGIVPAALAGLVRRVIDYSGKPVEVHCHDDFGLATANTLAALCAGAQVASTCLNGMGERAGCGATEEVAVALRVLYGVDLGLKLERLAAASALLQEYSQVRLPPNKAVVGTGTFAQEAGLVVTGWKEIPFAAEPYRPELVGQKAKLLLGKKSGKDSVHLKLEELGLSASEAQVSTILDRIKHMAQERKQPVSDQQFGAIVRETTGKGGPQAP